MGTLQDYDDNDRVPTPEEAEELIARLEGGEDEGEPKEQGEAETGTDEGATDEPASDEPASDKDDTDKDESPVVKTRDGKHEIPYSVLEAERRRTRELQAELEALRTQQAPVTRTDTGAPTDTGDEHLQRLVDEYGDDHEIVAAFRAERTRNAGYAQELADLKAWRQQQERATQVAESVSVEEAIDSVFASQRGPGDPSPLRQIQEEGGPLWDAAIAIDVRLQNDPETKHLPLRDRLEKVVEILGRKPSPKQPDADLASIAARKMADKEAQIPHSLSDLPGGEFADQSDRESIERQSPAHLQAKFSGMTSAQIDEYLARL